ncbi:MAG: mismatch-specific DNA-glycosylase [Acidimicrobiales bacterium]|nr:mismatch-specific DNA-glycosylase [Acidimicrobiales bacterium]
MRLVELPLVLARAHRAIEVGARTTLVLSGAVIDDPRLAEVVEAGGFELVGIDGHEATLESRFALPDHVTDDLRLLCCGLNPSLHAAEAGVGYVTGNNRFWPAMAKAGLASRDRDPIHLAAHDRIGMTDLVKRPTARADELRRDEYREGVDRLESLCTWLAPRAVAVVGLAGWRAAVDRKASAGWQERRLGPTPVYVLPSTSGLNAGTSLDDLVGHLLAAASPPAS